MKSKLALGLSGVAMASAGFLPVSQVTAQEKSPNIIYILADDMGYECIGAYGSAYKTPNIDALAEKGILYQNCHAQPLSSPTRVQTMTGRYNYKNYVEFGYMDPREKTFGNLAKEAGYATAMAGKWQLGADTTLPQKWGFDEYSLWQLTHSKADGERYANALIQTNGVEIPRSIDLYGPDMFEDFVEDFITRNKNNPFFVYYTSPLVHAPFCPTPDSKAWLDQEERTEKDTKYFPDMVTYLDKLVGRLVNKLKELDLYDNTIIMFVGDNGTQRGMPTPMKDGSVILGGKGMSTDAGTHVPLIVSWPAKGLQGERMNQLVDVTDFMPTFADAMGVKVPASWDTDGISLYPQITGQKEAPVRRWTICHYDPLWDQVPSKNAFRSARTIRYKLYSDGKFYDLKADILEKTPLDITGLEKEPRLVYTKLKKELDKLPAWKPGDKGLPKQP